MSDDYSTIKSRRCSMCGINFPPFVAVCRACGDNTWPIQKIDPDENWQELVAMHQRNIEDNEPESIFPHRADNAANVYRDRGNRLWITHADLLANGYQSVTEDTILYINGKFYEAQGYAETPASWLIEEVIVDGAADSLEPSQFDDSSTA